MAGCGWMKLLNSESKSGRKDAILGGNKNRESGETNRKRQVSSFEL